MEYIYCGIVVVTKENAESFRKSLEMFRIEFEQDEDDDGEDDGEDDEDAESHNFDDISDVEILEPEIQDVIDVEDEEWDDAKVKVEPGVKEEKPEEFIVEALDPPQEKRPEIAKLPFKPSTFRRLVHYPHKFKKISQKIIRVQPNPDGKISVERVVPSKKLQQFMSDNPQICPFCNKFFKTSKHRNEHVKYCFDNPDRIVSRCPLCGKSVCDPYYLRKHLRKIHGNEHDTSSEPGTSSSQM